MKKLYLILAMCMATSAFAQNSFPASNTIMLVEDTVTTYTITASSIGNGMINPDGIIIVPHGESLTFEISGFIGCSLIKHLWVDEIDILPVEMGYYTYTFDNVITNHTIVAEFVTTGINENKYSNFFIYPNPTTSEFRVQSSEFRVFDMMGRKQKAECRMQNGEIVTDISHLQAGMYFLKIDNQIFKIIKN